jgi:hypothetical protein
VATPSPFSSFILQTSHFKKCFQRPAFGIRPAAFRLLLSAGCPLDLRQGGNLPHRITIEPRWLTSSRRPRPQTRPKPAGQQRPRTGTYPGDSLALPCPGLRGGRQESPNRPIYLALSPSFTSTAFVKSRADPEVPPQERRDFRRQIAFSEDGPSLRTLGQAQAQPPQNIVFWLIVLMILSSAQNAMDKFPE